MKRRRKYIVTESESEIEVEISEVDCIQKEVDIQMSRKKTSKEIALEKAIETGARISKKIDDIEQIFAKNHNEDKRVVQKVAETKRKRHVSGQKESKRSKQSSGLRKSVDKKTKGEIVEMQRNVSEKQVESFLTCNNLISCMHPYKSLILQLIYLFSNIGGVGEKK